MLGKGKKGRQGGKEEREREEGGKRKKKEGKEKRKEIIFYFKLCFIGENADYGDRKLGFKFNSIF